MRGAFISCSEPCYLLAEGRGVKERSRLVELRRGKWTWELSIDDMPPNLAGGELHVGIIDMRKPKTHDHAGFIIDFGEKETRVVSFSRTTSRGKQASKHADIEKGARLALLLDLPGPEEQDSSISIAEGVLTDLPMDFLDTGWTQHYDEPYAHKTKTANIDSVPTTATYVFVGARGPDGKILVGAIGKRNQVLTVTEKNTPHEHNGVWWYFTHKASFGFAPNDKVKQNQADASGKDDVKRLSWHLDSDSGGYRAGANLELNKTDDYRKLIYWTSRETPKEGSLSLLVRKMGADAWLAPESATNIPVGSRYTPYIVWLPKPTGPQHTLNLMLHFSMQGMHLEKDPSFHPIESMQLSQHGKAAQLRKYDQLVAQQQNQQHAKITLRRVIGELRRVQTVNELQQSTSPTSPQSVLFDDRTGPAQIKLVKHTRLIGVSGDQRPVRLHSGSWWIEFGLESLPAHVSGQLRVGFMSDRLTDRDAAGYAIDFGPAKNAGKVSVLQWASGLRPSGAEQTALAANGNHRVALALSFPDTDRVGASRRTPNWVGPNGVFDEIEVGQRVIIADTELCEEIFRSKSEPWTELHNYFCGKTGKAVMGHVHRLAAPEVRDDGPNGSEHVYACYVKLKSSFEAAQEAQAERIDAADKEKGVLKFLPGCLLDAPEREFKNTSRERGCLSLYLRDGDKDDLVRESKGSIYNIPGDVPLKPFVEWISDDEHELQGIHLTVHLYASHFIMRDTPTYLPIASEAMLKVQISSQSEIARVAAGHIKKMLLERVQRRLLRNLYARRCVARLPYPFPCCAPCKLDPHSAQASIGGAGSGVNVAQQTTWQEGKGCRGAGESS